MDYRVFSQWKELLEGIFLASSRGFWSNRGGISDVKILITGGAGFIGSHTVDALLREGHSVRILDGLCPPVHDGRTIPAYVPTGEAELIVQDVRRREVWEKALQGVEAVYHLAAYQDYLPDFSTFFHVNTVSTALLYEVLAAQGSSVSKVVVASSQAVYGEGKYICRGCPASATDGGPVNPVRYPSPRGDAQLRAGLWDISCPRCGALMEAQWTDESVTDASTAYAMSKLSQELIALSFGKRYGVPTVCLRYSIVQGARQSFRNAYSGVLRIFAQQILSGKQPVCFEDGNQLRDYVSVHDVTRANLLVLKDARSDFGVFNVGGGRQVSVSAYARMIAARAGVDVEPTMPGVYRFGDTRHISSDISRLNALGWRPEVPLEQIIDEYLEWIEGEQDFRDYSASAIERMQELRVLRATSR
jgi:dTDP-L-rhamnose 4-epimerase